jgi:hypothetical protein
MLIALLAVLGVDLAVMVAFALSVLRRGRWLKRQPGEFAGTIRVPGGAVEGQRPKWRRGSGRRVRDVLAWSKAPFMFGNELLPVDRLCGEQPAHAGGVKRLGGKPVVIGLASATARIEVAARAGHRALVIGPLAVDVT